LGWGEEGEREGKLLTTGRDENRYNFEP
jgi:hypothetical protein